MRPRSKSIPTYEVRSFAVEVDGNPGAHKLRVLAEPYYRTFLNTHFKVGDKLTMTLTDKKPKRTEAQNRYLWTFYGMIAAETGHTPEEIHEWAKAKLLPPKAVDVMGETVLLQPSTTNLTRVQFGEFIDGLAMLTEVQPPPTDTIRGI